jgi:hypothetical protein
MSDATAACRHQAAPVGNQEIHSDPMAWWGYAVAALGGPAAELRYACYPLPTLRPGLSYQDLLRQRNVVVLRPRWADDDTLNR